MSYSVVGIGNGSDSAQVLTGCGGFYRPFSDPNAIIMFQTTAYSSNYKRLLVRIDALSGVKSTGYYNNLDDGGNGVNFNFTVPPVAYGATGLIASITSITNTTISFNSSITRSGLIVLEGY
jgi:hypothetical protein